MMRPTVTRARQVHPRTSSGRIGQDVRARVLDRIRGALAAGDEAGALRIARELERRFDAARPATGRRQG